MKKIKKFIKKHKYKFLVLACLLFAGMSFAGATIYFSAANVSYSNSNMSATNVQKAIEELHATAKPCVPKYAQMGASIVTSGDGLYADSVESGRYTYRGANPNNYICLASGSGTCAAADLYRIIAIEPDGTLKVIKNTSIGDMVWDPGYSSSISGVTSSSNIYGTRKSGTSTDYCYASSNSKYYGCKSWGSSTSTYNSKGTTKVTGMPLITGGATQTLPTYDAYLNVYLNGGAYLRTSSYGNSSLSQTITGWITSQNSTITNNIVDYAYNIGTLKYTSDQLTATDVSQESNYKWIGKVALMNASDFVRASTNSSCTGAYAYAHTSGCYNNTNNWLFNSAIEWTLSPYSSGSNAGTYSVWIEGVNGGGLGSDDARSSRGVRPVLHLSSSITLTGSGTNDANVYRIS